MKRRGIKGIVTAVVMVFCICMFGLFSVEAKEDKIDKAKNGIVEIYAGFTKDSGKFYKIQHSCGFVLSNQDGQAYVVTNYTPMQISDSDIQNYCKDHNISYNNGSTTKSIQIVIKRDVKAEAVVKAESKQQNYCILQVDGGLSEKDPLTLGAKESVVTGDKVYSLGFKIDADEEDDATEFSASDVKIYEGSVQDTGANKDGLFYIQHSARVTSGNTGGPILNENGYVVGLNDGTLANEDREMYYALPIDEVREVLDNYEINYESKDRILTINSYRKLLKECEAAVNSREYKTKSRQQLSEVLQQAYTIENSRDVDMEAMETSAVQLNEAKAKLEKKMTLSRKIVWVLAVTLAALAGWLVYLLFWKRKNIEYFNAEVSKEQVATENEEEDRKEMWKEPEEDMGIEKTMIVSEGTVVLGSSPEEYKMRLKRELMTQFKRRNTKAALINVQNGTRQSIDQPEWTMGKEDKNHCVISENRAVSRKHAKILWKKETYYIMDLGSVNGTFVNGVEVEGENQIQLHHGDKIVLANEVFEFREEA